MAIVKTKVDAVIVGMGWTGAIMAKELTDAGLRVVALERGPDRDVALGGIRVLRGEAQQACGASHRTGNGVRLQTASVVLHVQNQSVIPFLQPYPYARSAGVPGVWDFGA